MANGINKVMLLGNLGADADLRQHEAGAQLRFRMATEERYRDKSGSWQSRVTWHQVVMWGPRAAALGPLLKKGTRVVVDGKLETRSYESNGERKYITEVKAADVTFAGSARKASEPELAEAIPAE